MIVEVRGVVEFGVGDCIFIRWVGGVVNFGFDRRRMGNGGGVVYKDEVRFGELELVDVNLDDSNVDDYNILKYIC